MNFPMLLDILGNDVVFESGLLLVGDVNPNDVHRQLSRWVEQGRIYQLRRGLYALASSYQSIKPHPFTIANRMVRSSYVSCQSALTYYDIIPEYSPSVISVTADRTGQWRNPLGFFVFRHIQLKYLDRYKLTDLGGGYKAFLATPEKALMDLIYLTPKGDSVEYLTELRLQNLGRLDIGRLKETSEIFNRPKLNRVYAVLESIIHSSSEEI